MSDTPASKSAHWRDTAILVIGVWLFISPGFLEFNTIQSATVNTAGIGAVLTVIGGIAMRSSKPWAWWASVVIGLWLLASPWALSFAGTPVALWNSVACGLATGGLGASRFLIKTAAERAAA